MPLQFLSLLLTTTHLLRERFYSRSSLLLRWGRSSGLTCKEPLPTWLYFSTESALKQYSSTLLYYTGLWIQHRSRKSTYTISYSTLLLKVSHSLYWPGWRLLKLARRNKISPPMNGKGILKNVPILCILPKFRISVHSPCYIWNIFTPLFVNQSGHRLLCWKQVTNQTLQDEMHYPVSLYIKGQSSIK